MIEISIWILLLSATTLLTLLSAVSMIAYRVGLAKGQGESRILSHDVLRELQFRDELETEARKSRIVTRSGVANPGRSRIRKAIRGR